MKTLTIIIRILIIGGIIGFTMYGCNKSAERQEQYAIEHNCRWAYNDMCYTRDERPWLFE